MTEDLKVKIGSKEEALWKQVRVARENSIANLEETLIVEKAFLELAKKIEAEEKEKFEKEVQTNKEE